MNMDQKGFGITGVLILVMAIGLLGISGLYIFNKDNKSNTDQIITTNTIIPTADNEQIDEIQIDSLGVKFVNTETTNKLLISEGVNESQAQYAAFSTQALKDLETNTYCDGLVGVAGPHHLGLLFKVNGIYPSSPTDENSYGILIKQFDDFNLQFRTPADDCFEEANHLVQADVRRNELIYILKTTIAQE